jgi:hypothetical protein
MPHYCRSYGGKSSAIFLCLVVLTLFYGKVNAGNNDDVIKYLVVAGEGGAGGYDVRNLLISSIFTADYLCLIDLFICLILL